jgi:hypothetical protein
VNFVDNQLQDPADRAELVVEDTSIALLPDNPVDENCNCVKITPQVLRGPLPCSQPPIFSAVEVFIGGWEISLLPCPETKPYSPGKKKSYLLPSLLGEGEGMEAKRKAIKEERKKLS